MRPPSLKQRIGQAKFRLSRLQEPEIGYDLARILLPDIDPQTGKQRHGFESEIAAHQEARRRARNLVDSGLKHSSDLAEALLRQTARSLSCPVFVRELRRRFLSEVSRIAQNSNGADLHFYTVVAGKWKLHADDLLSLRPKRVLESLRAALTSEGQIDTLAGWMIAAFHNEHDPAADCYQPHVHAVVCGEKYRAFEALRKLNMFKGGKGKAVYRPILCDKITDVPRQVSYLFKAYWPAKPSANSPVSNRRCRARRGRRIPNLRHAESLLFLDQQRFSDLVWLHGLIIKDGRLVPTKSRSLHI